jgi:hypothetical protein
MNRLCHCVLMIASIVTLGSPSFAQTSGRWLESEVAFSVGESPRGSVSWADASSRDEVEMDAEVDEVDPFAPPMGAFLSLRLCHLSHHPRDGVRAGLLACPLFVASYRRIERPRKGVAKAQGAPVPGAISPPVAWKAAHTRTFATNQTRS